MPRQKLAKFGRALWANLAVIALLVSIVPGTYLYTQNRHRIDDIQASRVLSCEATYHSFTEMFRPFFPKGPKATWPKKQQRDWLKLQQRADELAKKKCPKQTATKGAS